MKVDSKTLTKLIRDALAERYGDRGQYVFIEECPVGTGHKGTNFIDALVIAAWPSAHNHRTAFEIKVSRQDFIKEIKDREKRRPAMWMANEFYFVAPEGLIHPDEVPVNCGLIEMKLDGKLITSVRAPERETIRPTWNMVATLCRKLQRKHPLPKARLILEQQRLLKRCADSLDELLKKQVPGREDWRIKWDKELVTEVRKHLAKGKEE